MPKFIITTTAMAPIRERWSIEADNAEHARALFEENPNANENPLVFLDDEIIGDEEDREVQEVVEVEEAHAPEPITRIARFIGQAWIKDNAWTVDESTVTFGITDREFDEAGGEDAGDYDALMDAAAAPDMVRNWTGPFEIEILDDDEAMTLPDDEMPPHLRERQAKGSF